MVPSPLRALISADQLARSPLSRAVLARRTRVAELDQVSLLSSTSTLGGVCRDLHGDLPLGMYCAKNFTLRSEWGFAFDGSGALIIEQNGGVLAAADFVEKLETALSQPRVERSVDELLSLVSTCTDCFWHWMMDSLPKVFIAESLGYRGKYLVPASTVAPWSHSSLHFLGIDSSRLIVSDEHDIRVATIYIPTYFSGFNAHWNSAFIRKYRSWLLSYLVAPMAASAQRLFVVRSASAKTRRIINLPDVESIARRFGFVSVCFELLSFEQQIQAAVSAQGMLAAHGSGVTHSLFMPEQSLLVELFPFARAVSCDCYETLAQVMRHRYVSIDTADDHGVDIEVDTRKLQAVLASMLDESYV